MKNHPPARAAAGRRDPGQDDRRKTAARRHVKARAAGSLAIGAAVAAAVTVFEDKVRHAALAASAARPLAHGGHQSVTSTLASGFAVTFVAVALVAFVVLTVRARRRRVRREAAALRVLQDAAPRRRGRAGAGR